MDCEVKNTPLDEFNWVMRIIHSCRDTFQINCAKNVIDLFDIKFNDDTLTTELRIAHKYQYENIHQILN